MIGSYSAAVPCVTLSAHSSELSAKSGANLALTVTAHSSELDAAL